MYRERKARINVKHKHVFQRGDEGTSQGSVIDFDSNEEFISRLRIEAARFAARENLPASPICGDGMRIFILRALECSHEFFRESRAFCPAEIITNFNPHKVADDIKRLGDEACDFIARELMKFRYVNLMIDAATVMGRHFVHITLSNPYSRLAPLPLNAVLKTGPRDWCINDYATTLREELTKIKSIGGLVVVSICHDRLKAQASAVSMVTDEALSFEDPEQRIIVDIPCFNHLLNTVFIHVLDQDGLFKKAVNEVNKLAEQLRSRSAVHSIGRRCPLPPKTRWLYVVDTILFLHRHRNAILAYLLTTDKPVCSEEEWESVKTSYESLLLLLLPMQQCSLALECEQSRLSDLIPLLNAMFECYRNFFVKMKPPYQETLRSILIEIRKLFGSFMPAEAFAAWCLTRHGRAHIRSHSTPPGLCADFAPEEIRQNFNDSVQNMKERVGTILNEVEDWRPETRVHDQSTDYDDTEEDNADFDEEELDEEELDEEDFDSCFEESHLSKVCSEETKEAEEDTNEPTGFFHLWDLSSLLASDWHEDAYSKGLKVIQRFMALTNDREMSGEKVVELFDAWLGFTDKQCEFSKAEIVKAEDDFQLWQQAYKFSHLRDMARVALRLLSLATGESDVERLISRHRKIVGLSASNMSSDVLLARLRIKSAVLSERARQNGKIDRE